jgi:hypothetical protein
VLWSAHYQQVNIMSQIDDVSPGPRVCWSAAMFRAAHPARCALCLLGLSLSIAVVSVALRILGGGPGSVDDWLKHPGKTVQEVGQDWLDHGGPGSVLWRGLLLLAGLSVIWGPAGAWIARAEALRQRDALEAVRTTPSRLVRFRIAALCGVLPMIVCMIGIIAGVGCTFGILQHIPLVGPLLIAILIPMLLVVGLVIAIILVGIPSFVIMPATIAVEGSDSFDALSRGYSYLLTRPAAFVGWSAVSLVVGGLPGVAVLALFDAAPGLMAPVGRQLIMAGAAALGFSLFWTLEALVYLRLRRLIDDTPENEIWDGIIEEKRLAARPSNQVKDEAAAQTDAKPPVSAPDQPPSTAREEPQPACSDLAFADVLSGGAAMRPRWLLILTLGVGWVALVMLAASWLAWQLAGVPGPITPEARWQAFAALGTQRPLVLVGLAVGVLVLGFLGLARPLRAVTRMAAVHIVFRRQFSLETTWRAVGRTRGRGIVSLLLMTAGIEAGLVGVYLLVLVWRGTMAWSEPALYLIPAVVFITAGAFGVGAAVVEDGRPDEERRSPAGIFIGDAGEILASAVAAVFLGLIRFVLVAGFAWLAWFFMCTTLGWLGGDSTHWIRWGLEPGWPPAQGAPHVIARGIAGFWFALGFALVAMYPLSLASNWGTAAYLLARQRTEEIPAGRLTLTEEEHQDFKRGPKKTPAAKLKEIAQRLDVQSKMNPSS